MENNPKIKFSWGTFCRRVIIDKETSEVSIIDVVPALNIKQVAPIKLGPESPNIIISLGRIYVTALFEKLDSFNTDVNETLNIEFSQIGLKSASFKADVLIKETELTTFINLDFGDLPLVVPSSLDVFNYNFEVIYRVKTQEIGRVVLPVRAEFKLLEDK
ncbi:MAG: hypothetical protein ACKO7R_14425 [Pseudanabaena sp.]